MFRFAILLLLVSGAAVAAQSGETRFVVANLQYFSAPGGRGDVGYAGAVVQAVAQRMHIACRLEVQPLNRALASARRDDNTLTFPVARTPEREAAFQWLLPLMEDDYVLVSTQPISARALSGQTIGVVRGSMLLDFAARQGYVHIDQSTDEAENLRKLMAGRFHVWLTGRTRALAQIRRQGLDVGQFHFSGPLRHFVIYVAASRRFDAGQARRWRQTYAAMQADGSLRAIRRRYGAEETAALDAPAP